MLTVSGDGDRDVCVVGEHDVGRINQRLTTHVINIQGKTPTALLTLPSLALSVPGLISEQIPYMCLSEGQQRHICIVTFIDLTTVL